MDNNHETAVVKASQNKKRFGAKSTSAFSSKIPPEILEDRKLLAAIDQLPSNYNFEIHKIVWRVRQAGAKRVALQFPDGLLLFACVISEIIENFTDADTVIMGDATYGACCVDDYSARALDCDFMVHFGHSCLIPINYMSDIKMLYVFVDIHIDLEHFLATIKKNFQPSHTILFVSTVQFLSAIHGAKAQLIQDGYNIILPQERPLSSGEILGCTSPHASNIEGADIVVYLGDGRFHLESIMISNPEIKAYKYDPYSKKFTFEKYDHNTMQDVRKASILAASNATHFGVILGTLGRQGSPAILEFVEEKLRDAGKEVTKVLLSEIFPSKLKLFKNIDAWVQIACPRLSIDWGHVFDKPLLTPYEVCVAVEHAAMWKNVYPMDFYAYNSKGPWTPNHVSNRPGKKKIVVKQ